MFTNYEYLMIKECLSSKLERKHTQEILDELMGKKTAQVKFATIVEGDDLIPLCNSETLDALIGKYWDDKMILRIFIGAIDSTSWISQDPSHIHKIEREQMRASTASASLH